MRWNVQVGEREESIEATPLDAEKQTSLTIGEESQQVMLKVVSTHHLMIEGAGEDKNFYLLRTKEGLWVWNSGRARLVRDAAQRRSSRGGGGAAEGTVTPPMPAVVVKVMVALGDTVTKGQALVVVSAMKMEMTLTAPYDGTVSAIHTEIGAKVNPGEILVEVEGNEKTE